MKEDRLWMRLVDDKGNLVNNIFDRVRVIPDPSAKDFPSYRGNEDLADGRLSFRQVCLIRNPANMMQKGHPKDKAFRLTASVSSPLEKTTRINWDGNPESMRYLEGSFINKDNFMDAFLLKKG